MTMTGNFIQKYNGAAEIKTAPVQVSQSERHRIALVELLAAYGAIGGQGLEYPQALNLQSLEYHPADWLAGRIAQTEQEIFAKTELLQTLEILKTFVLALDKVP